MQMGIKYFHYRLQTQWPHYERDAPERVRRRGQLTKLVPSRSTHTLRYILFLYIISHADRILLHISRRRGPFVRPPAAHILFGRTRKTAR